MPCRGAGGVVEPCVSRSGGGYPSDLTDEQWPLVEPLLPPARVGPKGGRREKHPRRRIVDAIFYVVRTGCAWRQLPKDRSQGPAVRQHAPQVYLALAHAGTVPQGALKRAIAEGREAQAQCKSQEAMQPDRPGWASFAVAPQSIRASTITASTTAITVPGTSRPPFGPSATVTTSPPSFHKRGCGGVRSRGCLIRQVLAAEGVGGRIRYCRGQADTVIQEERCTTAGWGSTVSLIGGETRTGSRHC
ncbi:transposase [Streptomyces sp. NPDC029216]|uniref:transposase n=1 Tax=Streptomyces sp. NPDC029216 TaxID=3154701 RepID=UPI0033C39D9B